MAAYTTQDELLVRFGPDELLAIADRDGDSTIDAEVVAAAIAAAQATIDSYIGTRYAVPLETVPEAIGKVAQDLARYELYTVEPTKIVADRYAAAIAWLKDISAGRARIDGVEPPPATPSANQVRFEAGPATLTRSKLMGL